MTEQSEDRLDRIERILERSAKEHAERFAHIEDMFANAAEQFNRNEERFNRNEERFAALSEKLDQLSRDIGFLYAVVNGHVSQSTPPAHQD
jgi:tetrahydromethanopterin S-methyltransferase subunit G